MSIEAKSLIDSIINSYNPLSVSPFIGSDGLFHFLYLTHHKNTYKFYLGKHTTNNLEDGYIGSGSHFRRALNKHGKDSFIHLRLLFLDRYLYLASSHSKFSQSKLCCLPLLCGSSSL
jgi:hypothetical protein